METWLHEELAEMGLRHWWYRGRRTVLRAVLETQLPPVPDRHLLEVGAGTGAVTMLLTDFGEVTAVEPHPSAREACQRVATGATVLAGDIAELADLPGLCESTFDVVGAFDVIEHLEDDVEALEAMRDLLDDDGRLILTVPALESLWGKHDVVNGHHRRYSRELLVRQVRASGFDPIFVTFFNMVTFPAVAGVRIGRRILRVQEPEPTSDFELPPALVNDALASLFHCEAWWVRRRPLPIGSSLIAVATKA